MAQACSAMWNRVQRDYNAHSRAASELQSAQSRRAKLLIYGKSGTKLGKAQVKAETAIKQAMTKLKSTYAKFERSEKAFYSCRRKGG